MNFANKSTRIYLGKINNLKKAEIQSVVYQFGNVKDFLMKETYAFVEYSSEFEAQQALVELDGRYIQGQRISAQFAKPKSSDFNYFQNHPRVYVGRLNESVNKEEFTSHFAKYGQIVDILVKEDFAFIEYDSVASAAQAIKEMNGVLIGTTRIVVEEARPKEAENSTNGILGTTRLYIGKIPPIIKKQDIYNAFNSFGDIIDVLLKDDYAFVEYTNAAGASRALNAMKQGKINGHKVIVEEARPREHEIKKGPLQLNNGYVNYNAIAQSNIIAQRIKARRRSPRRSYTRSRSRSK